MQSREVKILKFLCMAIESCPAHKFTRQRLIYLTIQFGKSERVLKSEVVRFLHLKIGEIFPPIERNTKGKS